MFTLVLVSQDPCYSCTFNIITIALSVHCLVPIETYKNHSMLTHAISCLTCGSILVPHSVFGSKGDMLPLSAQARYSKVSVFDKYSIHVS